MATTIPQPYKQKKTENALAKLIVSGSVTIVFEGCLGGHYLEMAKILKQTTGDTYPVITKRMIANKGLIGLLDGFVPWGMIQSSIKGASFGYGQALARKGLQHTPLIDWQKDVLSGGVGGYFQGLAMSPLLLLKTRVMTDSRFRTTGGFVETSYHALKLGGELVRTEGGIMALTKGISVFSFKRFCDWTTRFGFVVMVEEVYKKQMGIELDPGQKLPKFTQMWCSLLGGTLSALVTVPIDVTVAIIQDSNKKGVTVSPFMIYKNALKEKGVMGLFGLSTRGFVARVSHVAITVLMMKNVSSWCYNGLYKMRYGDDE